MDPVSHEHLVTFTWITNTKIYLSTYFSFILKQMKKVTSDLKKFGYGKSYT